MHALEAVFDVVKLHLLAPPADLEQEKGKGGVVGRKGKGARDSRDGLQTEGEDQEVGKGGFRS